MPKASLSTAIKGHAALARTDFCAMWKITRKDGVIKGLTEYWQDIPFNLGDGDGEITYSAADPFLRSAIRQSIDLSVDTMEVQGVAGTVITFNDILAGKYAGAVVDVFMINFSDKTMGDWPLVYGYFGAFEISGIIFKTELNSLCMRYQNQVVENRTAQCRADLGDAKCKVRLKMSDVPLWSATTGYTAKSDWKAETGDVVRDASVPDRYFWCITTGTSGGSAPSWNTTIGGTTTDGSVTWLTIRAGEVEETVTAVTSRRKFTIGSYPGDLTARYWNLGVVEWVTGANSGVIRPIKKWDPLTKVIELSRATRLDIGVNDTIRIRPGCRKDIPTCRDIYLNTHNKRSEDRIPGTDLLIRTPDAHLS